jgi:cytochrome c-type biogenesis protein CcmH
MLFWFIAIAVTAIACAALYYASLRRGVNAEGGDPDAARRDHHRRRLAEIDAAVAQGRLEPPEAEAAKGELARELLRQQAEGTAAPAGFTQRAAFVLPFSLVGIAALAFATYGLLGNPDVASMPLASRPDVMAREQLNRDILRIEEQLARNPDDLRGWRVIAPVYLSTGRYDDAVNALRRVNALQTPTADSRTDLAEALVLQNGGDLTPEARALLEQAVALDPLHARSRFYLAAETMGAGDYAAARQHWTDLLATASGNEPWYETARNGLAAAEQQLNVAAAVPDIQAMPAAEQGEMIRAMVDGLSERLLSGGGSLKEWEQLVHSRLVLGQIDLAQQAYTAAKAAYPENGARTNLDELALEGGLN